MSRLGRRRLLAASTLALLVAAPATFLADAAPHGAVPPPTPVPPDGRLSPMPSVLHTPADPVPPPDVSADGALLADLDSGAILYRRQADTARPIASLTKIMTALMVLERTEPSDIVVVPPEAVFEPGDYGATSTVGLRAGERQQVDDLVYALLLGSANDAAEALAIHVSGTVGRFVADMNGRAADLGMRDTRFASPHGLDDDGVSTPRDLLRLVRAADETPGFRTITATRFHDVPAPSGPDRRIQNRNALLWLYPGTFGTKTGFTFQAGSCLVASAERDGRRSVAIILHAEDDAPSDAAALLEHGFEGFVEQILVREGQEQGSVRIRGGHIPVVAGETLQVLLPAMAAGEVEGAIHVDPEAAYPPAVGERIGTLTFRAGALVLGSVPAIVVEVPAPEPLEGAWWARAAGSVLEGWVDVVRGLAA